jgi:hypothetical protein
MKTDRIHGVDRYEHSLANGELVVPVALLWNRPGAKAKAKNLTGAVAHGYEVGVTDQKVHNKRNYYRVIANVEGKVQEGWISAMLLEERGEQELKQDGA